MKTSITSLLIAVLLGTTTLSATSPGAAAFGYPVKSVILERETIERGSTEITVLRLLGTPLQRLSPTTWVYYNFKVAESMADPNACTNLIITCAEGKVADLKLVNQGGLRIIASNRKPAPSVQNVAKK